MLTLKKVWAWLKAYWYVPAVLVVGIAIFAFTRNSDILTRLFKAAKESWERQTGALETAERERKDEEERIEREYRATIARLEERRKESQATISKQEKERIKKYIQQYKDDPTGLTKKLAAEFGLQFGE